MTDYNVKDRIYGACALIPHKTDPDLFLGVTRKGTTDDFTLPGGKLDQCKWRTDKNGLPAWEKPKVAAARGTREETDVHFTSYGRTSKNLYTGLDENGNKARCFLVLKWSGTPKAVEEGTVVKWCTWDELCTKTFAQFNTKVRKAYEKVKDEAENPLIGKEIVKMSSTKWKVGFDKDGNMLGHVPYRTDEGSEARTPYVFEATLKLLSHETRYNSTPVNILVDLEKGTTYKMNVKELFNMAKNANIKDGVVSGFWSFSKNSGPASLKFFMNQKEE